MYGDRSILPIETKGVNALELKYIGTTWMLKSKLRSSARVTHFLYHWTISSAPIIYILKISMAIGNVNLYSYCGTWPSCTTLVCVWRKLPQLPQGYLNIRFYYFTVYSTQEMESAVMESTGLQPGVVAHWNRGRKVKNWRSKTTKTNWKPRKIKSWHFQKNIWSWKSLC